MAGIIIGIILIVLSVPIGAAIIYAGVSSTAKAFVSADQFYSDGNSNQVSITGTADMGIWASASLVSGTCQVADPSGNDVALNYSSISQNVNSWWLYATFTPNGSGTYTVACSQGMGFSFDYLVAPTIVTKSVVGGLFGGIAAGFVAFVVGLVLIIVTAVRRGKWTRTYGGTAPGMVTAYGQAMPPAYPPQAYPPQMPYQPPSAPLPGQ